MPTKKNDSSEHFEVSYTDLAGHDRYLTTATEDHAKAAANDFAREDMKNIKLEKITTSRAAIDYLPVKPAPAEPEPAEPLGADDVPEAPAKEDE